jgi:hypothetical protein
VLNTPKHPYTVNSRGPVSILREIIELKYSNSLNLQQLGPV